MAACDYSSHDHVLWPHIYSHTITCPQEVRALQSSTSSSLRAMVPWNCDIPSKVFKSITRVLYSVLRDDQDVSLVDDSSGIGLQEDQKDELNMLSEVESNVNEIWFGEGDDAHIVQRDNQISMYCSNWSCTCTSSATSHITRSSTRLCISESLVVCAIAAMTCICSQRACVSWWKSATSSNNW